MTSDDARHNITLARPKGGPIAAQTSHWLGHAVVTAEQTLVLFWLLRLAAGFEYIGHGAFGVITKAAWVPYFEVVGIPERWAWRLMPLIGSVDITLGLLVLLKPVRAVLIYMAVWGLWTALLRPLSGESVWELVERAPNYLIPLALLYLRGLPRSWPEVLQ